MGELHDAERRILLKLIHAPSSGFNELWAKEGESNLFAYHLGKVVERGLVTKDGEKYRLSEEGRRLSAFIEGDTGKQADFPTFSVVLLVKDGDNWLCQKRLKEPFYGYWGFVSGKINFGFNLFECATRDLLEETGLHASHWTLKCIEQVKTYENEKLLHHHYLFHMITEKSSGVLKQATHKAENTWMTLEEYKAKDTFPSEKFFQHIIPAERPILLEAERYMTDGKFSGMKTIRVVQL